jgi:hypothetical protein
MEKKIHYFTEFISNWLLIILSFGRAKKIEEWILKGQKAIYYAMD